MKNHIVPGLFIGLLAFSMPSHAQPTAPSALAAFETELWVLRQSFTDRHPLVQAQLQKIEGRRRAEAEELQLAKNELSQLRLIYTDRHPRVQALIERINNLEKP